MYIYFDRNGTIQEVINDESIRKGSNDYNKIYCYLEGNPDIDDIWYLQKNPDGTLTNEVSFVDNIVTKAIPYDSHRDMKYFQDFEEYQFYVFTLSSSYLSQNGLVVATIRVAENNTLWALGELTFNVQANVINSDNDITQSQYDYLLLTISSYYSKTEIDNKLNLKADKSDTYTKAQVDNRLSLKADNSDTYTKTEVDTINLNLAGQIAGARVELNNRINATNNILVETNAKVASLESDVDTLQNNTYSKTEVDEKIDDISAYTKSEIDTMINAKADKTTVEGINTRVGSLETDVADIKSVQNVVDVVATKSALNSYDTTKLDVNDKVQVIADESHDGASTIYNWNGSAWQYVGAFGGNSYTKQETYNKTQIDSALSDKADKSNTYTRAVIDSMILTLATEKADKSTTYTKTEIDGKLEEIGPMFEIVEKELEKKSTVVANPTLSGDEPDLEGAEIDGIKYKVGGGSEVHLYQHLVKFTSNKHPTIEMIRLSTSNTPFTKNTFFDGLGGNIYSNFTQSPVYSSNTIKYAKGIYETAGGSYKIIVETVTLADGAFTSATNEVTLGTIEDIINKIF